MVHIGGLTGDLAFILRRHAGGRKHAQCNRQENYRIQRPAHKEPPVCESTVHKGQGKCSEDKPNRFSRSLHVSRGISSESDLPLELVIRRYSPRMDTVNLIWWVYPVEFRMGLPPGSAHGIIRHSALPAAPLEKFELALVLARFAPFFRFQ